MNTLLNRLGFEEQKHSWTTFDMSIKKLFYRNALFAVFMLGCSIFLFTTGSIPGAIVLLAIVLGFGCYIYYQYLYFAYGKFEFVVGTCVSVEKKINEFLKHRYYEKCTLTILSDDMYYQLPIRASDEIEKNSRVIVYMTGSALSQINENTYRIDNPLAFSVLTHPD